MSAPRFLGCVALALAVGGCWLHTPAELTDAQNVRVVVAGLRVGDRVELQLGTAVRAIDVRPAHAGEVVFFLTMEPGGTAGHCRIAGRTTPLCQRFALRVDGSGTSLRLDAQLFSNCPQAVDAGMAVDGAAPDVADRPDANRDAAAVAPDAHLLDTASPDVTPVDATQVDGSATDQGTADMGQPDSQGPDAAAHPDATRPDTARPDAPVLDAAAPDAVVQDSAAPDAAATDAIMPDAARPDAARTDARLDNVWPLVDGGMVLGPATRLASLGVIENHVFIGTSADGRAVLRHGLRDGVTTLLPISIAADTTGTDLTANTCDGEESCPPFVSLGTAGCAAGSLSCGPDNENGSVFMRAVQVWNSDWLVFAGSKPAGDLNYVFLAPSAGPDLALRYVDLHALLGDMSHALTAAFGLGDVLYLGFSTSDDDRPLLLALGVPPPTAGLEATEDLEVVDLHADNVPDMSQTAAVEMIDALWEFGGRLYVGNRGGCVRATVAVPRDYKHYPDDWASCTPTDARFGAKQAVAVSTVDGVWPRQRAVPQVARFGGRLYMGRNTVQGPQLWACEPGLTGDAPDCDPGDWHLAAPNTVGDPELTQINDPSSTALTLVVATSRALVLGFDNAAVGVRLFASASPELGVTSFQGQGGCSPVSGAGVCPGLGENGLGDPRLAFIADGQLDGASTSPGLLLLLSDGYSGLRGLRLELP